MALKFSKRVRGGTLVTKHGDKYIRCGRRARPVGVFQPAATLIMITDTGQVRTDIPRGIVTYGPTIVQFKESSK